MIHDESVRPHWDTFVVDVEIVEKIDDFTDFFYMVVPSPTMLVSKRDFLSRRVMIQDYKGVDYFCYMTAEQHKKKPPQPKTVRGRLIKLGRMIRKNPTGKGCTISLICQTDIAGSIPKWIVNLFASNGPKDIYNNMMKHYPTLKKKGLIDQALLKTRSIREEAHKKQQLTSTPAEIKVSLNEKVVEVKTEPETPKKEEAPKEEAPKEEAPKEDAPKEEAPKEEAPKEEAPKEEAPKEEEKKPETG